MLSSKLLRNASIMTLFFFVFYMFSADIAYAQQRDNDPLLKARNSYRGGDYESAIKILNKFITDQKSNSDQKLNIAEAYYLLSKIYFEAGDDAKVDENLRNVFTTYPTFERDETNMGLKDRVDKIKKDLSEGKPTTETAPSVKRDDKRGTKEYRVISKPSSNSNGKKFPVLWVVGGVAVAVILALVLSKKKSTTESYDIRGSWNINMLLHTSETVLLALKFSGSLSSGTFTDGEGYTGKYSIDGSTVAFEYDLVPIAFNGTFSNNNTMSGITVYIYGQDGQQHTGTWTGTRTSGDMPKEGSNRTGLSIFKK